MGTHLVVVHHGDVCGRLLDLAEVGDRVLLGAWHSAGGQDLIVLVHAQWLAPQVLHGQGLTAGQRGREEHGTDGLAARWPHRQCEGCSHPSPRWRERGLWALGWVRRPGVPRLVSHPGNSLSLWALVCHR